MRSGGYERSLVACLLAEGRKVSLLNPARARQFGKATGRLPKTDRIDAELLADYGRTLRPETKTPPEPLRVELTDVMRRRSQLAELLGLQRTQRQQLLDPFLLEQLDRLIAVLEAQIAELERRLDELINRHGELCALMATLRQVEGVGKTTAISLLAELPELGPFYKQLRSRGKNHRVAITAVMRKLLIHLNKISNLSKNPLVPQHR